MKFKLRWIIVNVTRGLFDGHYDKREMAEEVADYWASEFPGDRIIVCEVVKDVSGPDVYKGLPDHNWMANAASHRRQANG